MSSHSPPRTTSHANSFPSSSEEQTLIAVTIHSQDGEELETKVRPDTIMRSLLRNYCRRKEFEYGVMKFFINGEFFDHRRTAAQVGLQNGDQIDCMMPQDGGGICASRLWTKY